MADTKEGEVLRGKWQDGGILFKYLGLVSIAFQCASLVLVTRYVRTREGDAFLPSSAILMSEILKIVASLLMGIYMEDGDLSRWISKLYNRTLLRPLEFLKVTVPSFLYVIQNNLLYIAVSSLDAATYQVLYQLKILTTAVVSVLLLKRTLSASQWLSLLMLFIGVSVVQLQAADSLGHETHTLSPTRGFLAILSATLTSAFAGVYMEKLLKDSAEALWIRNVQLGTVGLVIAYTSMMWKDGQFVRENSILHGYDSAVWLMVCLHAFGGLLVALVMRYADNILKGLSTSASIVISCVASVYLFDFQLTLQFTAGTGLVILAVYVYSTSPLRKAQAPPIQDNLHKRE